MASAGNGSAPHMAGELFKMMAGVNLVHVPYRGQGPALTDLLGGQVQVLFATAPGTTEYISTGKLRALAVTTAARAEVLPELPTVGDFVPGYETSQWYGICAPRNTPAEIVDKLNKEINAAIADPSMKARFAAIGGEPLPGSPAEFGKSHLRRKPRNGAKVVRARRHQAGVGRRFAAIHYVGMCSVQTTAFHERTSFGYLAQSARSAVATCASCGNDRRPSRSISGSSSV